MDSMKGTSKDEIVVSRKFAEACMELAVVDQPAGFVDNEKRKDNPTR